MLLHSQYLPLMISPGRDWNSKYMINQLIRTKDFSLLHHLLRNPPPSHLLHKSLNPSPLTQGTLSLTFSTLHPFPHLLRNPLRPSYTIHPSPHLLHNPPLPSSVTQYIPSLPACLAQSTPPLPYPLITLAVSAQAGSQSTAHLSIRWIFPGETQISQLMHLYSGTTEEQPVKLEAWIYL